MCEEPSQPTPPPFVFILSLSFSLTRPNLTPAQNSLSHPIHLHGHDFWVLAQDTGMYHSGTTALNTVNPPRRDVATLPGNGYLAIAFQLDNPGAWYVSILANLFQSPPSLPVHPCLLTLAPPGSSTAISPGTPRRVSRWSSSRTKARSRACRSRTRTLRPQPTPATPGHRSSQLAPTPARTTPASN